MFSHGAHESRVARVRNSVRTSASDDYTKLAAEQARKRLDMEKVDRLAVMHARTAAKRAEEGRGLVRVTTFAEMVTRSEKGKERAHDGG